MTIDSHHHFWCYTPEEYGWLEGPLHTLRRDFVPRDLEPALRSASVDYVVSVQARTTLEETRWLLEFARTHSWILGVVGWVPLLAPDLPDILESFAGETKLRSVRHICQAEPEGFLLDTTFNNGIARLAEFQLAYDLLIVERQTREAVSLVDRHPGQSFIIDHMAKPRIREKILDPWKANLRELSRRPNVWCKVSGLVTEADIHNWQLDDLRPYVDAALEFFGPERLLFGSDWPVCTAACSYQRWHDTVQKWAEELTFSERAALFGGTAQAVYRITLPSHS